MKVLYLINNMQFGGVETLTLRLARNCKDDDFIFLSMSALSSENELVKELKKTKCLIIDHFNLHRLVLLGEKKQELRYYFQQKQLNKMDIIYAFNLTGFIYAHFLRQYYFPDAKIVAGVYHPNEYAWGDIKEQSFLQNLATKIISKTSPQNFLFINEGVKKLHEKKLRKDFSLSPILPIPIDLLPYNNINRYPEKFKIVSIGRICDFKAYNFAMLDVMEQLYKQDTRFSYHIYGHGPMEQELIAAIKQRKLEHFVFFYGPVLYNKIPEIFKDAFVFVGMGTALVEASAAGVPSLQAIISNQNKTTYGWFHNLSGFNIGEAEDLPEFPFYDLILKLANYSDAEYNQECLKAKAKANSFSILTIMPQLMQKLQESKSTEVKLSWIDYLKIYLSAKYYAYKSHFGFVTPFTKRYHC